MAYARASPATAQTLSTHKLGISTRIVLFQANTMITTQIPPSKYGAIEIARRRFYEKFNLEVYDVLDSDNPGIEDLPISWDVIVDGPVLPPKDCWYVLCNAEYLVSEQTPMCGGTVRFFCVSKTSGEVLYEGEYDEE